MPVVEATAAKSQTTKKDNHVSTGLLKKLLFTRKKCVLHYFQYNPLTVVNLLGHYPIVALESLRQVYPTAHLDNFYQLGSPVKHKTDILNLV